MDPDVAFRITQLAADHHSGATAIAAQAAEVFALAAEVSRAPGEAQFLADLAEVGHVMMAAQPAMAPLFHLANSVLTAVERAPAEAKRASVTAAAKGFAAGLGRRSAKLVDVAQAHIGAEEVVLTLSASGTVEAALLKAHRAGLVRRVICAESRPLNEGVELARRLSQAGVPVTLVADALAPSLVREATLVLVGADTVSARGIVNKTGTYALALAAEDTARPFVVLATSDKLLPTRLTDLATLLGEERDASELLPSPLPAVAVLNRPFDLTPLNLVSSVVTEKGAFGSEHIGPACDALAVHPLLDVQP